MTYAELKAEVLRLAGRTNDATATSYVGTWINRRQTTLCTLHPYNFLTVIPVAMSHADIELCASGWTAGSGVTITYPTEGGMKLTMDGTIAASQKLAYKALSATTDYSAYTRISIDIWNPAALVLGDLYVCLCSDTAGATPVTTIPIPATALSSTYVTQIVNAGAMTSAAKSVALYTGVTDPPNIRNVSIYVDEILATTAFLESYTTNDGWQEVGWLTLREGVSEYSIRATAVATKAYIQKLRWVKQYDFDGSWLGDIDIEGEHDFFYEDNAYTTGEPDKAMLVRKADGSYIRFSPVPDDNYLVAISLTAQSLTELSSDSDTNYLSVYYPHILIAGGLAEMFSSYLQESTLAKEKNDEWLAYAEKLWQEEMNYYTNEIDNLEMFRGVKAAKRKSTSDGRTIF